MRERLEVTSERRGPFGGSSTRRILAAVAVVFFFGASWAGVAWPLRVSGNGRYLEDQSGVPFLVVGGSPWSMTVHLSPSEMDTYFNDRAAKGYTAIILRAIDKFGNGDDYSGNRPFTNGNGDWSVRNEAYWQTLDTILAKAKAKDMVVFLAPAYLGYGCSGSQGWCPEMQGQTDTAMYEYGQWVGTRYQSQGNLVWVDGGDADAAQYANALSRVQNVKSGIDSVSSYLHTAHAGRNNQAFLTYGWIDVLSPYSECANMAYRVKQEYDRSPARPLFEIEATYENEGADLGCVAAQSLWTYLGGGFGAMFGNNPIWDFGAGWSGSSGIASPGSYEQSYVGKLIRSRAWWRLVPDYSNAVVTSAKGSLTGGDYIAAARASDAETVMVYAKTGGSVTVDMTKVSGSDAKAWWYNPETGGSTLAGTYPTTGTRSFSPPSSNYVLVLDDASKGLAAPGTTVYPYSGGGSTNPPPAPTNLRVN